MHTSEVVLLLPCVQDDACSLARVLLLSQEVVEALRPPKKDLKTAIMCIRRNIAPLMKEVSPMLRKVASVSLCLLPLWFVLFCFGLVLFI